MPLIQWLQNLPASDVVVPPVVEDEDVVVVDPVRWRWDASGPGRSLLNVDLGGPRSAWVGEDVTFTATLTSFDDEPIRPRAIRAFVYINGDVLVFEHLEVAEIDYGTFAITVEFDAPGDAVIRFQVDNKTIETRCRVFVPTLADLLRAAAKR